RQVVRPGVVRKVVDLIVVKVPEERALEPPLKNSKAGYRRVNNPQGPMVSRFSGWPWGSFIFIFASAFKL
ncbi:MAG: hypothetical protein ACE5GQ_12100, partial [Nitrospinales bacterium]